MIIRQVTSKDVDAILAIYRQYIDTPITCECVLPTKRAFTQRVREITDTYPYLVCEFEGRIIGYAYAHRHMERKAYEWNAELSVYLDKRHTAKGLGKRLYTILIDVLRKQGVKTVIAGVTLPNPKSEGLHQSFGFQTVGVYHNTAFKNGHWYDVAWLEKQIAPYDTPVDILPVTALSQESLAESLALL